MLLTRTVDYREIIKAEFLKRRSENPFYSLRKFSKELGIAPSHLSYLIRGERGLSKDNALQVGDL
jgi:plasmid maintenance system antidote protein VapI